MTEKTENIAETVIKVSMYLVAIIVVYKAFYTTLLIVGGL